LAHRFWKRVRPADLPWPGCCHRKFVFKGYLGRVIDAVGDARQSTYIIMISDHGENAIEHRLAGKNNMYDSASRVVMMISGPSIKPNQVISDYASLNDVFPTVLAMAGIVMPTDRQYAGRSLLPLIDGTAGGDPDRKDYVIAQYHSVASITGAWMVRKGDHKLMMFGPNRFDPDFAPQLFNLAQVMTPPGPGPFWNPPSFSLG